MVYLCQKAAVVFQLVSLVSVYIYICEQYSDSVHVMYANTTEHLHGLPVVLMSPELCLIIVSLLLLLLLLLLVREASLPSCTMCTIFNFYF